MIVISRILILISLILSPCLLPFITLAKTQLTKEVYGTKEAYFIDFETNEIVAPGKMITIDNKNFVPLTDILSTMGYTYQSGNEGIQLEYVGQNGSVYEKIDSLPKATTVISSPTFTTNVQAGGALIAENHASNILFQKNGDTPFFPASTVKLMTALLALENGQLTDQVTISPSIRSIPSDSSTANLSHGESFTLEQLLYAMMVPSGNDAAVAIAVHIAGSEEKFVQMMNTRAKELDATKTNFTNSHGYHHPSQITTAEDLAKIGFELAKHPVMLEIMGTPVYSTYIKSTNGTSVPRTWHATNQQIKSGTAFHHPAILGGKTGYTSDSLHTLVSFAKNQESYYVTVILRGDRNQRYYDTQKMLNQAISSKSAHQRHLETMKIEWIMDQTFTVLNADFKENVLIYQNEWYVPLSFIEKLTNNKASISHEQLYKLTINNELISFMGAQPVLENGRILVPFRQLFESLGLQVRYEANTNKIIGIQNELNIELQLNSNIAFINNQKVILDAPIQSKNNVTMVPARIIIEATQSELDWGKGRTIYITQ